jgi:hypothetical protein
VAVNGIYASIIPSYKYNLVLKSFSYGTQVMGHPVYVIKLEFAKLLICTYCNFFNDDFLVIFQAVKYLFNIEHYFHFIKITIIII